MAGVGVGISKELISLEIASPSVPDLTLIDLPGITRVAVKGQPADIGEQVCWCRAQRSHPDSSSTCVSKKSQFTCGPQNCVDAFDRP